MFLDSGNITSDHTIYAQCQNCGGKVPEFSAESLCLHHGMATSGCYYIIIVAIKGY